MEDSNPSGTNDSDELFLDTQDQELDQDNDQDNELPDGNLREEEDSAENAQQQGENDSQKDAKHVKNTEEKKEKDNPSVEDKVRVRLKAVGNAPILKQKKFYIGVNEKVSVLKTFLQKQLKLGQDAQLFLYCNSAFAPSLDQKIGELHSSFKEHTTQDLIIDYGTVGAYG
uniref:Ubiquitin-like protein ATG12 n=1 Tax=Aplanochytrium stocchinoi TaxID=215587 RepID=A0A7S3PF01_9STRA